MHQPQQQPNMHISATPTMPPQPHQNHQAHPSQHPHPPPTHHHQQQPHQHHHPHQQQQPHHHPHHQQQQHHQHHHQQHHHQHQQQAPHHQPPPQQRQHQQQTQQHPQHHQQHVHLHHSSQQHGQHHSQQQPQHHPQQHPQNHHPQQGHPQLQQQQPQPTQQQQPPLPPPPTLTGPPQQQQPLTQQQPGPVHQPQQQQQQQQSQPPPPPQPQQTQQIPHHHMGHSGHHPHGMMMNQPYTNHPNYFYGMSPAPQYMPHHGHGGHGHGPPPQFNPAGVPNHRPDNVNMNSQQQPQPGNINNQHQNNIHTTQQLAQMPPVINTPATGTANVHQMNNGPLLEAHNMQNRLTQPPYMMPPPYMHQSPYMGPMMGYLHAGYQMPPPSPGMMPPRISADPNSRQPFEHQNQAAGLPAPGAAQVVPSVVAQPPIPSKAPLGQPIAAGIKAPVPPPQVVPNMTTTTPITTKPRARKALAIVDPKTKHVFTEDELRGSPSTTTATAPTTTTTTATTTTATATATATATTTTTQPTNITTTTNSSTIEPCPVTDASPTIATLPANPTISLSTATVPPTTITTTSTTPATKETTISASPSVVVPTTASANNMTPTSTPSTVITTPIPTTAPLDDSSSKEPKPLVNNNTTISTPTTTKIASSTHTSDTITKLSQSMANKLVIHNDELDSKLNSSQVPEQQERSESTIVEKHIKSSEPINELDSERNDSSNSGGSVEQSPKHQPETTTSSTSPVRKTNPKLPYEAGQFSPLNPNGSKKYSIKFLRAVFDDLKERQEIVDSPQQQRPAYRSDFAPSYINNPDYYHGSNNSLSSSSGQLMRRSSQQVISKPRKVINTHSLQQEVELKTVENPWKPELMDEKDKAVESGKLDDQRLIKVFRGHLNKLTPQKYDSLIEKIRELDLNGAERLNRVIDLVFDKAVDEPSFCELYAKMCKVIAANDSSFCFHLVKKCQSEFETPDLYDGLNVEARKVDIENEPDIIKRKFLSDELYEEMRLRRKKYLGTIKLIGEMYKLGLLIPVIIGFCMKHLLQGANNENLECLCSLIETVGAKLAQESDQAIKDSLKNTLQVMKEFAKSDKTHELFELEKRIKYKIMDTIELSNRSWKPRMAGEKPEKIDVIREEADREMLRQQHNHLGPSKMSKLSDDRDNNSRHQAPSSASSRYPPGNRGRW